MMQKKWYGILLVLQICIAAMIILPHSVYAEDYNSRLTDGECGETVAYSFDQSTRVLTLSGNGATYYYDTDEGGDASPFMGNQDIETVIVQEGITEIGEELFSGCHGIKEIELPESLQIIGEEAFDGCTSIRTMTIPGSVDTIGARAFHRCYRLKKIDMPAKVQLGYAVFEGCRNLSSINLINNTGTVLEEHEGTVFIHDAENNPWGGAYALYRYPNHQTESVYKVEDGVTGIYPFAFDSALNLKQIVIPETVTYLSSDAFTRCDREIELLYQGSILQWSNITIFDCDDGYDDDYPVDFRSFAHITFNKKADLKDCYKPSVQNQTWTGKSIRIKDVPGFGRKGHIPATVKKTYKNNKNVGKATVIYQGTGDFEGTAKVTFRILPKGTKVLKTSGAKKAAKVTWKKQAKQTDGYQIQFATDKKFQKNKKTFTVKGSKQTAKTCKGLKGHKKYYVRIRTFKTVKGEKYCSQWSKVKTVKTK